MKTKKSKVLIMLSIAVIFFISSNSSYCDAYSVIKLQQIVKKKKL